MTMAEMDKMSNLDFAILILNERKNKLSNPFAPMAKKLSEAIAELDAMKVSSEKSEFDFTAIDAKAASQKQLRADINRYCSEFLKRTTYGECKAFCPFHVLNSKHGIPMCCDRAIAEYEDDVRQILESVKKKD